MRILFIGNSFTQRNDLPGLITHLAAQSGADAELTTGRVVANGASLRQHWNAGEAVKLIEQGWDYVVLQEQSTLPIKNRTRFHDNVRLFVDPVHASGAKLALYQTWARQHAPETQPMLNDAYNAIGAEIGALVVPVGEVWAKTLAQNADLPLYDKDGSHPAPLGTYLAACVFVKALYPAVPLSSAVPAELKLNAAQAEVILAVLKS